MRSCTIHIGRGQERVRTLPTRGKSVGLKRSGLASRLRRACLARRRAFILSPRAGVRERRRTQRARGYSESYFQALIENIPDMIVVLNEDGTLRYQNSTAEQVFGYRLEDILGMSGFNFVHPDDFTKVRGAFAQLLRRPKSVPKAQLQVRRQDGEWRMLEARAMNLLGDSRVEGIVIVCRDVTERKQAEADVRQAYNDAKRQVRAQVGKLQRADSYIQAEVRQRQRAEVALQECEAKLHTLNRYREKLETQLPRISGSTSALRSAVSVIRVRLEAALAHPEHVDWNKLGPALLEETRRVNQLIHEFLTNRDALYPRDAPS